MNDPAIVHLPEVDSTNLYCLREADRLASGTLVVADRQTAGRGRRGRTWYSPPGGNLYATWLLKPPFAALEPALLPQVAALSVQQAVVHFGIAAAWIKWPNDVYAGAGKLAGILAENRLRGTVVTAIALGVGVNLNMSLEELAGIGQPAASIAATTGREVCRDAFVDTLASYFNLNFTTACRFGFARLYPAWRAASGLLGRRVELRGEGFSCHALVEDLEVTGGLRLRLDDGSIRQVLSGDISLRLEDPPAHAVPTAKESP